MSDQPQPDWKEEAGGERESRGVREKKEEEEEEERRRLRSVTLCCSVGASSVGRLVYLLAGLLKCLLYSPRPSSPRPSLG